MDVVCDACSLLNLMEGGLLGEFGRCASHTYHVGEIVLQELGADRSIFEALIKDGDMEIVFDLDLPTCRFLDFSGAYRLGDGESEALAAAEHWGFGVLTDDKAARKVAQAELGRRRVMGSIGLLREWASVGLITGQEAYDAYRQMVEAGAFLPRIRRSYFP